ncbi:EamA family transporter [Actinoplanes sp. NPDC048796]|uniref:EamA family transporter n=1 Tax=unclassified Actinoplanes TaxID=2626549 RepID=UPI0033CD9DBA
MRREPPAPLLVLTAIASVQVGSSIAHGLFDDLGANGVTFLRLALAAVIFAVVTRPRIRSWSRPAWLAAALLGVVMAGMNLIFYQAIRTVPLGIAVTVEFLGPLLLALVQTRRLLDLLWALMAAGGVLLLGLDNGGSAPITGLLLAFLAGLFWAGYIVCSARLGGLVPGAGGLTVSLSVAALIALPFGGGAVPALAGHPSWLIAATAVALLSSVLSYGLEIHALRKIPTQVFGILMSLEPAAAAVAGLIILGQRLGGAELVALVLVTLASAGVTLAGRDKTQEQAVLAEGSRETRRT